MRPVNRGTPPTDASGKEISFEEYNDAREDLVHRIGAYCSYCELPQPTPDVEHVQPKSLRPTLRLVWKNFLLACKSCNSIKQDKPVRLSQTLWPDRDNTARAFLYEPAGVSVTRELLGQFRRTSSGFSSAA